MFSSFLPLKAKQEVRPGTRNPGTLASTLINSSVIPSLKYSSFLSALMFTNGRTATLFSGIAEPVGGGWTAAFFLRESSPCNSSVICLATALLMVSARDGGDGMAGTWGDDVTWLFPSDRRIAGAKITNTSAR